MSQFGFGVRSSGMHYLGSSVSLTVNLGPREMQLDPSTGVESSRSWPYMKAVNVVFWQELLVRLSMQILDCFASGETLSRADLKVAADYDSVGRALRQLVKDKKLVRVGRGRYCKADQRSSAAASTIAEAIERKVRRSKRNVFLRSDFNSLGSYDAVGRALRQKADDGKLVQIGYGLYAKAERSPFTGKPAPVVGIKRLATEALGRLGKKVSPSSFEESYNRGESTQVPTGRTVAVEDRVRRRIGYDGNYVLLQRSMK